jgi:hypothetical protein
MWEVWAAAGSIRSYQTVRPAAPILTEAVLRRALGVEIDSQAGIPFPAPPHKLVQKGRYDTILGGGGTANGVTLGIILRGSANAHFCGFSFSRRSPYPKHFRERVDQKRH